MPVQIEDVLALLPEMFPGTQQIPLKNIRPNPDNPGAPLTDPEIQDLAQNIAEAGFLNPLKVKVDKANPLAVGVQIHPTDPRLTAENRPWALSDFNYMILAGENRYRAFEQLKRATIPGFILNPTVKEAVKITHLDNEVRDRGWWAAYQTIEQYIQADPSLTLRQIGVDLKMDPTRVSKAVRLLPLLNPAARALIVGNSYNSNKGIKGISEVAALRLADLGPGGTLKPGVRKEGEGVQKLWPYPIVSPQTQDLVRRALEVAIEQELTEAGVKGLVAWVQDGGNPGEYGKKTQKPEKAPSGQLGVRSAELETPAKEEEDFKPIPWSENVKKAEFKEVPVSRVRVHSFIANCYKSTLDKYVERSIPSMRSIGWPRDILVRSLSPQEKEADSNHDFELFDGLVTFKAAQTLGWETLLATVYPVDEWEGVRLFNLDLLELR